jgi:gas vesicle protein
MPNLGPPRNVESFAQTGTAGDRGSMKSPEISLCKKLAGIFMDMGRKQSEIFKIKFMNNSKVLLGFLAGAFAGSILGVLFAPDKGAETRRKISEKTEDMSNALKEKVSNFTGEMKRKLSSAKEEAEDVAEKGFSKTMS